MARSQDTIYALSSGTLPAGVAVIRISGGRSLEVAEILCGVLPVPRQAALRWIRDRNNELIDQGLVLLFLGPASFTGEDCIEFHVHGGRASVAALLATLASFEGVRLAEAGEFSRRAFDNGKMDLVEAEGLADLIAAETEMQRRLAMEQSNGHLSALYQSWMTRLTRCRALIEAELDFPEEEDISGSVSDAVWKTVAEIAHEITDHLGKHKAAEIVRDGFKVVIAGRPNAGKSSLLNALAQREVAIVTEIEGTTRDLISVDLDMAGYLVRLTDTAGMRATEDRVEQEGVRRAIRSMREADLVLVLKDVADGDDYPEIDSPAPLLKIVTKVDTRPGLAMSCDGDEVSISARTGFGIDSLTKRISDGLAAAVNYTGEATAVRARQVDLLRETFSQLDACVNDSGRSVELRAEDLRKSAHLLGKITGFVDVEDLLDVIFSEFCIGK
jgi:tRNA modification GTPase